MTCVICANPTWREVIDKALDERTKVGYLVRILRGLDIVLSAVTIEQHAEHRHADHR